jgi:hypothetical protein
MNRDNGQLPAADSLLEQFSRIAVPADAERQLEARLEAFLHQPPPVAASRPVARPRFRTRLVRAAEVAAVVAIAVGALIVVFGERDAWAQVARSFREKPWVRWSLKIPQGAPVPEDFQPPEAWFSAEHKVAARRMGQTAQYIDLAGQEAYDYDPQSKTVYHSLTRDTDNVEIGHFETLLRLVAEGDRNLKVPESPIQILRRTSREVSSNGSRWTEYSFECRDPRRSPAEYRVTLRVDPATSLPVEMRSTEKFAKNDPVAERTYFLEYPPAGPADIYALGAPRSAPVVDRRGARTKNGDEIRKFLAAYDEARRKPLERWTTVGLTSSPEKDFADIFGAFRGRSDGQRVVYEEADFFELEALRKKIWSGEIARPADGDRAAWWPQHIAGLKFASKPRGEELLPDHVGHPDLTPGASPIDNPDCEVTLDRQPTMGPPGTVLLSIRTSTAVGFNDCFYWIAPERDYLVLRQEIHFSRDHAEWDNSTQIIDQVQHSPGGRWYATTVRMGRIAHHGDDLPAETILVKPDQPQTGNEIGPTTTTVNRYLIDFE